MKVNIFTDGGARGNNRGAANIEVSGAGWVIEIGKEQYRGNKKLNKETNNQAEYMAVILALDHLKEIVENCSGIDIEISCDSELITNQLNGVNRTNNAKLKPLHKIAITKLNDFNSWDIRQIDRSYLFEADELVNMAMDDQPIYELPEEKIKSSPFKPTKIGLIMNRWLIPPTIANEIIKLVEMSDDLEPVGMEGFLEEVKLYLIARDDNEELRRKNGYSLSPTEAKLLESYKKEDGILPDQNEIVAVISEKKKIEMREMEELILANIKHQLMRKELNGE